MNQIINKRKKTGNQIKEIINEAGEKIVDKEKCANILNEYFINVGNKNKGNEKEATKKTRIIKDSMFLKPTNKEEVEEIINKMKTDKAQGPDNIKIRIFKDSKKVLSKTLADLINESIEEGKYPDNQKISRITPVYKGGEKNKK